MIEGFIEPGFETKVLSKGRQSPSWPTCSVLSSAPGGSGWRPAPSDRTGSGGRGRTAPTSLRDPRGRIRDSDGPGRGAALPKRHPRPAGRNHRGRSTADDHHALNCGANCLRCRLEGCDARPTWTHMVGASSTWRRRAPRRSTSDLPSAGTQAETTRPRPVRSPARRHLPEKKAPGSSTAADVVARCSTSASILPQTPGAARPRPTGPTLPAKRSRAI